MPDRVRNTTDIEKALVELDATYREYTEAGGAALSEHRKVGVLMRMLPASLHEDMLKNSTSSMNSQKRCDVGSETVFSG